MRVTHRLILLVALAMLPAAAMLAWNAWDLRRDRAAEVEGLALRQAQLVASEIRQILNGARNLLTAVAEVPAVRTLDAPACSTYLAALAPRVPYLAAIGTVDLDGKVVCRHAPVPADVRIADRGYFKDALASGGFVVGTYVEARASRRPILPLALPLTDPAGGDRRRTVGVLVAALDLGWLGGQLRERALAVGGSVTVADRDAVILAREPQPERFVGTRIPEAFQRLVRADRPGALEVTSQDGTRRVLGYVPSGPATDGIYVSAGLSSESSFAAVDRATARGAGLTAAGLLLALAGAGFAGHRFIHRPLQALAAAVGRWRAGDYAARAGAVVRPGSGELGELAAAFDGMVEAIARREAALRVSEARLRAVIECLPFELWVCDREGRYVVQNSASRRLRGDLLGRRPDQVGDVPAEVAAGWVERNARALAGETVRGEWRFADPRGGPARFHEDLSAPVLDGGEVVGIVGVNMDVTERRASEERQRLLLRELSHRVKNTLATVQAIAAQSLSGNRSLAEGREVLVRRLRALAATHDLLTASGWQGTSLRAVAEAELKPYGARADLTGTDLVLSPRAAQALGLILHELATNAAKHGALSVPGGRVTVAWGVAPDGGDGGGGELFRLDWREAGGPPVEEPRRSGFGRRLVEGMAAHELKGEARLLFEPGGVTYRLRAPWAEVVAGGAAAAAA